MENALSGTAFALDEPVDAFGFVPAYVPVTALLELDSTVAGGLSTFDPGVYSTDVVKALDPAALEAEAEYVVEAAEPLAPDETFD